MGRVWELMIDTLPDSVCVCVSSVTTWIDTNSKHVRVCYTEPLSLSLSFYLKFKHVNIYIYI